MSRALITAAAATAAVLVLAVVAEAQRPMPPELDADVRAEVLDDLVRAIDANYVFPEIAADVIAELRERQAAGRYDQADAMAFCMALSDDLARHDGHFRVWWSGHAEQPGMVVASEIDAPEEGEEVFPPQMIERMRRQNFGVRAAEVLDGNIGYLDVRAFMPGALNRDAVTSAMHLLAHTDAMILDLRHNGGGAPDSVQFLCSWFFGDEPVHLNSLYFRPDDATQEFWTLPELPGTRRPDVPLYVLTSGRTASAAEECAYNLQTQQRATLVGETTAGGANPGGPVPLVHGFEVFVSTGAAINPITGTNWEGVGVVPHVEIGAPQALARAHWLAVDTLRAETDDAGAREAYRWTAEALQAQLWPVTLDAERVANYAGRYGPRTLVAKDGALFYSRDGGAPRPLLAVAEDRFVIDGVDGFRLEVETDASGRGVALVGHYDNGMRDRSPRSE